MAPALLSLHDVSKSYERGGREIVVLDRVSLDVERGEVVGIHGRRGSGKTTLINLAAGREEPDSGAVRFEGRDLSHHSACERADWLNQDIAVVTRDGPRTAGLSVLDYVALPLMQMPRADAHRRARKAMVRVGVADCADQPVATVSEGTWSLVAIAHALVRKPKLLLGDDPVAGLGVIESSTVLSLLADLVRTDAMAVVLVTPEVPDLRPAARVMSLSHGRLTGPPPPSGTVIDLTSKRRPEVNG